MPAPAPRKEQGNAAARGRPQPAGTGSATSAPAWLKRTDTGGPLLATYQATGQVDVSQVGQLQGGVATGMSTAGEARSEAAARR